MGNTKKVFSLCGQVTKLVILIRTCTSGKKQFCNQCLVFEYTFCISVSGLRKFYVSDSSVCSWNTGISGVWYSEGTVPFEVKCCSVMKRWNYCCCYCCCCCEIQTAAVIVGWFYMVRHPFLHFFSQNVLLSLRGAVISYFRHGLHQCFPNNCTVGLLNIQVYPDVAAGVGLP